jgi:PAS domain S-box-containing protein
MIFQSLWPLAEEDRRGLKEQYGKDRYPAIFPEKVVDGGKVAYQGRNYLASFAGTIHPGWSVFFFRPIELAGSYRLTGIAVACVLAILALAVLGANFYLEGSTLESAGRIRAVFDAAPEAMGVIDPDTLEIVEANRSLALLLGYTPKELLSLKLDRLISHTPQEIQQQLWYIQGEQEAFRMVWRGRKKDGALVDLEVVGSRLEHQGKEQVLIFCRHGKALPQPHSAPFRDRGLIPPAPPPEASDSLPAGMISEMDEALTSGWTPPGRTDTGDYAETFDREARKLIKRIEDAIVKVEKIRRSSGSRPNA